MVGHQCPRGKALGKFIPEIGAAQKGVRLHIGFCADARHPRIFIFIISVGKSYFLVIKSTGHKRQPAGDTQRFFHRPLCMHLPLVRALFGVGLVFVAQGGGVIKVNFKAVSRFEQRVIDRKHR